MIATELREFLLYTGPVILKDGLPASLYIYLLCLHTTIELLSSEPSHLDRELVVILCNRLLSNFVQKAQKLCRVAFCHYTCSLFASSC
jgi:hypothetical protein